MVALELRDVGIAYATQTVLSRITLHLTPGWVGLVGENGAGKTSLLRALAGELAPAEGKMLLSPRDAVVAVCPQDVEALAPDVERFATSETTLAGSLRARLALASRPIERWSTLSPGERKRWQIGAALAREPDVLLVDEPTNHLDGAVRDLLVNALARFDGIGVVVSHDRSLLEELPRAIVRVHAGRAISYPGAYTEASRAWDLETRARQDERDRASARTKAAAAELARARRIHASAARGNSSRARMKNAQDHDGREAGRKYRAATAESRTGRIVSVARADFERARAEVPVFEKDRTLGRDVFAAFERAPSQVVFHLDRQDLRVGSGRGAFVLRDIGITIRRDDRVRITGPNGAGKTTLVRALLASRDRAHDLDRILYLPQELQRDDVAAMATDLTAMTPDVRGRVLSVFAALGSDPERIVRRGARAEDAGSLSPGEARKLSLAMGLGRGAWALVLDEPTNHLDLPTIERLERALVAYPGCLVVVSHDDAFASRVTTSTVHVGGVAGV